MMTIKNLAIISTIFIICSLISACQSVKKGDSTFNSSIEHGTLSNGIPVYVRENKESRIVSVYIVVKGGVALLPPENAGLEMALMRMMKSGSDLYSYDDLQTIKHKTSSDFFGFSNYAGSGLGIECIDYYFDIMIKILSDGFINPSYGQKEYETMIKEYSERIQSRAHNPESLLADTLFQTVYKGHPYETNYMATPDSIKNITVDNMKKLHERVMDPHRIAIVASGGVKCASVIKKLDSTIGSIPVPDIPFSMPEIPDANIGGDTVVKTTKDAEGTGFAIFAGTAPAVNSKEWAASIIGSNIYSDNLHQIVREKYGACYTALCGVVYSAAPFCTVQLYRISDLAHVASYVSEAQRLTEEDKIIVGRNETGYIYASIEDRLESYINNYITSTYIRQMTAAESSRNMASNLLLYGTPDASDEVTENIRSLQAEDVLSAFNDCWTKKKGQWVFVTGPDSMPEINFN